MVTKLTGKQKTFVNNIVKGDTATAAALKAYDTKSPRNAAVIASNNLQKPEVRQQLEKELAKLGITLQKSLKPISKGLVATKKDENGEIVDDLDTQLKASDRALKLLLPKEKLDSGLNVNFNIDSANFGGEFVVEGEEE